MRAEDRAVATPVVLFDGRTIDSRAAAAASMLILDFKSTVVDASASSLFPWSLLDRDLIVVGLGVASLLEQRIGADWESERRLEAACSPADEHRRHVCGKTHVLGAGGRSASDMAWQQFHGDELAPDLIRGVDWLTTGQGANHEAKRMAAVASELGADVEEIVHVLRGCSRTLQEWRSHTDRSMEELSNYCARRAAEATIVSMAGAKVAVTETDADRAGAVASATAQKRGCIGAAMVQQDDWTWVTLSAAPGTRVDMLSSAFGGEGCERIGWIRLSPEAGRALLRGELRPRDAYQSRRGGARRPGSRSR